MYSSNLFDENLIQLKYEGLELLLPTIKKGTKIGTFKIIYDNKVYREIDVILEENIESEFSSIINNQYRFL